MTEPFALAHLCLRHRCRQDKPQVECYSGHTYAQEPRAFVWQGRRCQVTRVERRWRAPEGPAFCVQVQSGDSFELWYNERADRWTIRSLKQDTEQDPK